MRRFATTLFFFLALSLPAGAFAPVVLSDLPERGKTALEGVGYEQNMLTVCIGTHPAAEYVEEWRAAIAPHVSDRNKLSQSVSCSELFYIGPKHNDSFLKMRVFYGPEGYVFHEEFKEKENGWQPIKDNANVQKAVAEADRLAPVKIDKAILFPEDYLGREIYLLGMKPRQLKKYEEGFFITYATAAHETMPEGTRVNDGSIVLKLNKKMALELYDLQERFKYSYLGARGEMKPAKGPLSTKLYELTVDELDFFNRASGSCFKTITSE